MIRIENVKQYCRDDYTLIKNYEQAVNSPEKWECHHWNEQWFTRDELKKLGRYYNVPHDELVFMTHKEHHQWHSKYGAEEKERCRKISESQKGRIAWNKGKTHSEETKRKMSEAHKGHPKSEETKQKMREKRRAYWENKKALKNTALNPL